MCQTPDQMLEWNRVMPGYFSASNRPVFTLSAIHASLPGQLCLEWLFQYRQHCLSLLPSYPGLFKLGSVNLVYRVSSAYMTDDIKHLSLHAYSHLLDWKSTENGSGNADPLHSLHLITEESWAQRIKETEQENARMELKPRPPGPFLWGTFPYIMDCHARTL